MSAGLELGGAVDVMVALSPKYTRWLGLCLLAGGLLWAVDIGVLRTDRGVRFDLLTPMFLMAGLMGLGVQERERLRRTGRVGALLIFLSWLSWVLMSMLPGDGNSLHINILAVSWAFLQPVGFFLMGVGLKGALRVTMFAIASLFLAPMLMVLLSVLFPGLLTDWNMNTANSPPPFADAFSIASGLGLALMGLVTFRAGREQRAAVAP